LENPLIFIFILTYALFIDETGAGCHMRLAVKKLITQSIYARKFLFFILEIADVILIYVYRCKMVCAKKTSRILFTTLKEMKLARKFF